MLSPSSVLKGTSAFVDKRALYSSYLDDGSNMILLNSITFARLHGITSQKAVVFIGISVRTSNPNFHFCSCECAL
jgi:hypothetical protein